MVKQMDFIDHFKTVFRGREDVVAEHWEFFDRRESKMRCGYRPICNNRKVKGICPKFDNPKFGCAKCIATNFVPITDELLKKHFDGRKILGVYPLLRDNTCWFIAADFDNHDGEHDPYRDILSFYEVCETQEVPIYICRSKSGKGYHAYMFFDRPIPAWKARVVMFALIQEAQIIDEDVKISDFDKNDKIKSSSFDRLFPAQDKLKDEGSIGNLIAMEFQGKAVSNGNTVFLDPVSKFVDPYPDQLDVLKNIQRIPESDLDSIIKEWKLEQDHKISASQQNYAQIPTEKFENLLKCDFIKWAFENQSQVKEPLWLAGLSNVVRISPGGFHFCHEFSKHHPSYNYQETENKARYAYDNLNPITCDWIKQNGYDCEKKCGVKSPIGLINRRHNTVVPKESITIADAKDSIDEILSIAQSNPKELALKVIQNPTYVKSLAMVSAKDEVTISKKLF